MQTPQIIIEKITTTREAKETVVSYCKRCGTSYTAEAWENLAQLKPQHVPACPQIDDKPAYDVLLANCPCGTTLGWEVPWCECGAQSVECSCSGGRDQLGDSYTRADDRCPMHGMDDANNEDWED